MDPYSSAEELIKARKPYTITKQRERWTEEEHNRFLEALKLYGRAWQRIEEHIGTKTAVQIRSHAQKFFTKLEKEALSKGVPIGKTLDIDIPPPRPKKKPSNPYPRKTSVGGKEGKLPGTVSALCNGMPMLDLEKEPLPEKSNCDEKLEDMNEGQNHNAESFNLLPAAPYTSQSALNKNSMQNSVNPVTLCTFREFIPTLRGSISKDETSKSIVTADEHGGHQKLESDCKQSLRDNGACKSSKLGSEKLPEDNRSNEGNPSENFDSFPTNDMKATEVYPKHVPIHTLDGSLRTCASNITSDISYQESVLHHMGGLHGHANLFGYPTSSATSEHQSHARRSSAHHSFPSFHPLFTPTHNQDDYRAFVHTSPTFPSLIVSALLQNPAAHAAASFAATFWPGANLEAPADSNAGTSEGFSSPQVNATPTVAAIAAATVAAATSWWAAHGLLPVCAPLHTAFTCSPAPASTTPMDITQARATDGEKREVTPETALQDQQVGLECPEALQEQHSDIKSPCLSTSDSEECEDAKLNTEAIAPGGEQAGTATDLNDTNNLKTRKLVDRSSCGSNTPSSSEVEADGLEKHENENEELKEHDINRPPNDPSNRRARSFTNTNDSWKAVSEEGRMAFRALFSREVLPQSFSPPQDWKIMGKNIAEHKSNINVFQSNLNGNTCGSFSSYPLVADNTSFRSENIKDERLPIFGVELVKLKPRQTGFKPYKRCSVEANESRIASTSIQDEEKAPKRLRVEGEASTSSLV